MDRLGPEFAAYWLAEPDRPGEPDGIDRGPKQALSPSQQVALELLACLLERGQDARILAQGAMKPSIKLSTIRLPAASR